MKQEGVLVVETCLKQSVISMLVPLVDIKALHYLNELNLHLLKSLESHTLNSLCMANSGAAMTAYDT